VNDALTKPDVSKPRLAKRPSMTINRETNYRVSKAQSLRMRAYDKKIEAAETKAKSQAAQKAKPEKAMMEPKPSK
jgi:hypothetical protein